MGDGTNWVDVLSALLTPTIALAAVVLGFLQYRLAKQRRKDDLFDRRYAFYESVRKMWMNTGVNAPPNTDPDLDVLDLVTLAYEAEFLFGEDISQHILSLGGRGHEGHPFFPNEDFVKPFKRYLNL